MSRWQAGQSGNPKGRPKRGETISELIRAVLREKGPEGIANRKLVAQKLVALALDGNMDAIKVVLDRVDGKVVEKLEHSGAGGGPLILEYVNDWRSFRPTADPAALPPSGAEEGSG